jgi:Carboxypeptidase regulatory-like domain
MNSKKRTAIYGVSASLFAVAAVTLLDGQSPTATVFGTVTDSSGAVIPDADISVTNIGTATVRQTATDGHGRYAARNLPIGNYEVRARKRGFATVVHEGIVLDVGSVPVIDFTLPVGQAEETVSVDASVSQVDIITSSISSLVDGHQMRDLPLNGRNFEQLILLAPGTISYPAGGSSAQTGRAFTFAVAGARPEGTSELLDGEDIQNWWQRGSGAAVTGTSLGIEAIAEFQVLTNTYGAEYGGDGSVVNAATRSGTNSFHGSVYDFIRNSALDARGFFDRATPAPFRKNQFGAALGGPIKKNKLFFFVNYEGIRQLLGISSLTFVPTAAARASAVSFMQPVLALYPLPTTDLGNGTGTIIQVANQTAREDYVLGRVDYTISAEDAIFVRYLFDNGRLINPSAIPLWIAHDSTVNQFTTIEERHIFSANLVNVFSTAFSRPTSGEVEPPTTPALQLYRNQGRQDATLAVTGLTTIGSVAASPFRYVQNKFTQNEDLLWVRGSHTIQVGARFRRGQINSFSQFQVSGSWIFTSLPSFLAGQPFSLNSAAIGGAYANRDFRDIALSPYFQDDWKIFPRLTLNLGIRYEWQSDPVATHPVLNNVIHPPLGNFQPVPHAFATNPSTRNVDPRFGFAFDVFGDHKTSLRGGIGIMHDPLQTYTFFQGYTSSPPFVTLFSQTTPGEPLLFPSGQGAPSLVSTLTGTSYNLNKTPYQMQWNLNVQRQLFTGSVLTLGYSGSRGIHLLSFHDYNPPQATQDSSGAYHFGTAAGAYPRINPNIATLDLLDTTGSSIFHALQANFTEHLSQSVLGSLAYMFSKCIDYGYIYAGLGSNAGGSSLTNPYDFKVDRGLCLTNVAQNLVGSIVYSLPFRGNGWKTGWQMAAIQNLRTGAPFTVIDGFDRALTSNSYDQGRPNYISGCNPFANQTQGHWFNAGCYALQPVGTLGNSGRSNGTAPGYVSTDVSLTKDTNIHEQFRLQFRAELFNVFNHTNLGLPAPGAFTSNGSVAANAGTITSIIGNARKVQFGLKVLF